MKIRLLIVILFPLFCYSQKQGNIWYFGDHAGLDFNSGTPVALTNGQTYLQSGHTEGTAVISDSSGSLLFYTNGEKVWNKNHQEMANGDSIYGSFSSTQSSLIIPLPGQQRLFYLFTQDDFNHHLLFGFRYSVIDMCLDNGLGDVVAAQKNILVLDTAGEKLTGVRHANGIDYWIIVHKYYSDAFYAYQFSAGGLSNPVISHIGSVHTSTNPTPVAAIGYMKASPDGNRLALVSDNGGHLRELFDFNKSTGVVSNFINLHVSADSLAGAYGLSFSPDNSKLYFTGNIKTNQYDLHAGGGNADSIRNSLVIVNPGIASNNYGLQLGPDGKIYVTEYNSPFLSVIDSPNVAGLSCHYLNHSLSLLAHNCNFGLPNFVDSYDYSNTSYKCTDGILENESDNYFSLVPDPFYSFLELKTSCTSTRFKLQLYDLLGREVFSDMVINKNLVYAGNLDSGMYIYTLTDLQSNKMVNSGKIIRQ